MGCSRTERFFQDLLRVRVSWRITSQPNVECEGQRPKMETGRYRLDAGLRERLRTDSNSSRRRAIQPPKKKTAERRNHVRDWQGGYIHVPILCKGTTARKSVRWNVKWKEKEVFFFPFPFSPPPLLLFLKKQPRAKVVRQVHLVTCRRPC